MKVLSRLFISAFLFIAYSERVIACSCTENTPLIIEYQEADSVFTGKVKIIRMKTDSIKSKTFLMKNATVTFEIENIYKGLNHSPKRIVLNTSFNDGVCGFSDFSRPRLDQKWIVFVYRNPEFNTLHMAGMCGASSKLKNSAEFANYEKEIFDRKDKQGIIGRVYNSYAYKNVENVEVTLEGGGKKLTTKTDEQGLYYFPVASGDYKLTVIINGSGMYDGGNFSYESTVTKPDSMGNLIPIKSVLTYNLNLKESTFIYDEVRFWFAPNL